VPKIEKQTRSSKTVLENTCSSGFSSMYWKFYVHFFLSYTYFINYIIIFQFLNFKWNAHIKKFIQHCEIASTIAFIERINSLIIVMNLRSPLEAINNLSINRWAYCTYWNFVYKIFWNTVSLKSIRSPVEDIC